jgi:hypothetical protein
VMRCAIDRDVVGEGVVGEIAAAKMRVPTS